MRIVVIISALFAALGMAAPGASPAEARELGNLFERQGCIDSSCCGVCCDAGNCQVSDEEFRISARRFLLNRDCLTGLQLLLVGESVPLLTT